MSEFLFGDGFAISGGDEWRVRRKAVGPSLHKAYLAEMTDRVFGPSAQNLCSKLEVGFFPTVGLYHAQPIRLFKHQREH